MPTCLWAVGHGVGQEELQGVSGRGGADGNMLSLFAATHTAISNHSLWLYFHKWLLLERLKFYCLSLFCCCILPSSLLLSTGPASHLLAIFSLALTQSPLNLCMSWFNSLTQQRTIWTLHFDLFSAQLAFFPACGRHEYISNISIFISSYLCQ